MDCKNCKTALEEHDEYCRNCGGKVIRNRLSFKNLFEHLSETFFNYDNKLLRTFIVLFTNPEDVIDGYVNGVRKKYVNPISFFGVALTVSGISIFFLKKYYLQYLDFSSVFANVPNAEATAISVGSLLEYNSLFYGALVPLFALISWIVFLDKKYNFTEHMIIYLYSMSVLSILSVVMGHIILLTLPEKYLAFSVLTYLIMLAYHIYILKQLFALSVLGITLRTILFFVVFVIAYIITIILVTLLLFLFGVMDLNDFKPK